jgi:hypothetical protein
MDYCEVDAIDTPGTRPYTPNRFEEGGMRGTELHGRGRTERTARSLPVALSMVGALAALGFGFAGIGVAAAQTPTPPAVEGGAAEANLSSAELLWIRPPPRSDASSSRRGPRATS